MTQPKKLVVLDGITEQDASRLLALVAAAANQKPLEYKPLSTNVLLALHAAGHVTDLNMDEAITLDQLMGDA